MTAATRPRRSRAPASSQPEPYDRTIAFLLDLVRETMAHLAHVRRERTLEEGRGQADDEAVDLDLDPEALARLAAGERLSLPVPGEDHPVLCSLPLIAARYDLPPEIWWELAERIRKRRLERTRHSDPAHPAQAFARVEERLDPFSARVAGLLLCHQVGGYLDASLRRAGQAVRMQLEVGEVLGLLLADPGERLEQRRCFAPDAPLYTAEESLGDRHTSPRR